MHLCRPREAESTRSRSFSKSILATSCFICGGAFAGLERVIQERSEKSGIGFGADIKSKTEDERLTEFLNDLEPEDLVKYGLIPEFVGRMPVIATLEELDEDALVTILTEPKNSLVKQYQKLFELEGVALEIRDDALSAIAKRALARKTGARGLRSILESPSGDHVRIAIKKNTI